MKAQRSRLPAIAVVAVFGIAAATGIALSVQATKKLWPSKSGLIAFEKLRTDIARAQSIMPKSLVPIRLSNDLPAAISAPDTWSATRRPAPLHAPPNLSLRLAWPQRVDHRAVLAVSQELGEPLIGRAPASWPALTAPLRHDLVQVVMAPPTLLGLSAPEAPLALPKANAIAPSAPAAQVRTTPPTPAPVSQPRTRGPNEVAVLRIVTKDDTEKVVFELADGKVVTVEEGADLGPFRLSRIQGERIWIRMGRRERSFSAGQFFAVR